MSDTVHEVVEELLHSEDVETFARQFAGMVRANIPIREYASVAMAFAARHLYRDKYPRFVPHSYLGLIGAWQAREYLQDAQWEDRHGPLAQQLWYLATEAKSEPAPDFPPKPEPPAVDRLAEAYEASDASALVQSAASLLASHKTRAVARAELIRLAAADRMNLGHKFLYTVKGLLAVESLGFEDPARYLYAPLQYTAVAPKDRADNDLISDFLGEQRIPAPKKPADGPMTEAQLLDLRAAVLDGDETKLLATIVKFWKAGYAPAAIQDLLQLVAAHLVYYGAHEKWIYPVHGYNFTECLYHALRWSPADAALRLLMTGALYLATVVGVMQGVPIEGPIDFADAPGEPPDAGDKRALADYFRDRALAVGRVDGPAHFGHDIKFLYAAISALKRSDTGMKKHHLAVFNRFFARADKPDTLSIALRAAGL